MVNNVLLLGRLAHLKPELPWRRRQQSTAMKKAWWQKIWASRTAWGVVAGAAVWVLANGVESLSNLRKLPSEVQSTYHMFKSWYFDGARWTGTWSSREEGDVDDYKQAEMPLELSVTTERGSVQGGMFNRSVCELNPMLPPVFVEGEIVRDKLVADAFVIVGGQRNFLYSFSATRSAKEPVITLVPLTDPLGLMPPNARLVHRIKSEPQSKAPVPFGQDAEHHDLVCPASPIEYLQRLRKEGALKGVDKLHIGREPTKAAQ